MSLSDSSTRIKEFSSGSKSSPVWYYTLSRCSVKLHRSSKSFQSLSIRCLLLKTMWTFLNIPVSSPIKAENAIILDLPSPEPTHHSYFSDLRARPTQYWARPSCLLFGLFLVSWIIKPRGDLGPNKV